MRRKVFRLEPELTIRLAQWGIRLYEVPVSYSGRTYAEGKKIGWRDGVRAVYCILNFSRTGERVRTALGYAPPGGSRVEAPSVSGNGVHDDHAARSPG